MGREKEEEESAFLHTHPPADQNRRCFPFGVCSNSVGGGAKKNTQKEARGRKGRRGKKSLCVAAVLMSAYCLLAERAKATTRHRRLSRCCTMQAKVIRRLALASRQGVSLVIF